MSLNIQERAFKVWAYPPIGKCNPQGVGTGGGG